MRERLGSRIGFILLSAGCAIGLGNVWRFPYIAGQNGGGWFVVIYLACLALIGLPVLIMEFASGRAAQRSIARLHGTLTPERPWWRLHGAAGMIGNVILMMFYAPVTGWMLIYFQKMASGTFVGLEPDQVGAVFGGVVSDPAIQIKATLIVVLGASLVCAIGLKKGIERVTKVFMFCLFVLILALAANSIWLDAHDGSPDGLGFYLVPDFARMRSVGVAKVIVEAMNHAFFTLSLGIGAMSIFGSYIGRERTLLGEGLNVAALDTVVAVASGLVILPACFAYGIDSSQGPSLVFVTLPNVFNHMPLGRVWGMLFFVFMSMAALTTILAVFETILACLRDYTGISRVKGCLVLAVAILVLTLPCIFGFNIWSGWHPFDEGSCVLDFEDFIVSNLLLPLGGLAFVLYCTWRFGWGWKNFCAEANEGRGPKIPLEGPIRIYCGAVLPIVVLTIFYFGLYDKFSYLWR